MTLPKYKPCCGMRCMVSGCRTQKAGGCYCICRMVDHKHTLEHELEGKIKRIRGCYSYRPEGEIEEISDERKKEVKAELDEINAELKKWELYEEPEKLLSFQEVVNGLKEGKMFKRKSWGETRYILKLEPYKLQCTATNESTFSFCVEDFEANDWIEAR